MAKCCGTMKTEDGTFYCDRTPVAAYTWDSVPFNYKGKPGAAVCDEHEGALTKEPAVYPGLVLVDKIKPKRDVAGPYFTVHYPSKTAFVKDTWRVYTLGEGNAQVVTADCFSAKDAKRVEDALNDLVWAERLGDR